MKPSTPDDVLDLLDGSVSSAALGAAMELGLFWLLDARSLTRDEVAAELGVPPFRCGYWLEILVELGLIEKSQEGYAPTAVARNSILKVYGQKTWALLSQEARERMPGLSDLAVNIRRPGSAWKALGKTPPDYIQQMTESPERAEQFTRMLYEIHAPLADELAEFLDLTGVERLMDLGGGSGVVSLALLRRHPGLAATVVDIPNVCAAGRRIAEEVSLGHRIEYHAADFVKEKLPSGFDMVIECDVNVYSEALFRKVYASLNPGGRYVVVDGLAPAEGVAPRERVSWAFQGSLRDPGFSYLTAERIRQMLASTGFESLPQRVLRRSRVSETTQINGAEASHIFKESPTLIEARRPQ